MFLKPQGCYGGSFRARDSLSGNPQARLLQFLSMRRLISEHARTFIAIVLYCIQGIPLRHQCFELVIVVPSYTKDSTTITL